MVSNARVAVDDRPPPDHTVFAKHRRPTLFVVTQTDLHVRLDKRPFANLRVAKVTRIKSLHTALHGSDCEMPEAYHAVLPLLTAPYPIATLGL